MSIDTKPFYKTRLGQVVLTGIIAFCCPGFFNALQGLGSAGNAHPGANDGANVALYSMFAIFGYLGGVAFNFAGPKILLCLGGVTYALYAAAAYYNGVSTADIAPILFIISGGILGIGAAWFWTAQGALMMAYADRENRGKFIAIFWFIFNLGGCVGGILQFAINYSNDGDEQAGSNATSYFVFVGVMLFGSLLAFLTILPTKSVLRQENIESDNTSSVLSPKDVSPEKSNVLSPKDVSSENVVSSDTIHPSKPNLKKFDSLAELKSAISVWREPPIICLFLLFFGSNWFYTYVFNCVNGVIFTVRTRGLNSALYWASQMFAAYFYGRFLDGQIINSQVKNVAKIGAIIMIISFSITYSLGAYLQYGYEGTGFDRNEPFDKGLIDFANFGRYWYPLIVVILYGIGDSLVQVYSYWLMGAMGGSDASKCAQYAGFYKGAQSVGAALSWMMDIESFGVSYSTQFLLCVCIFYIALPPLGYSFKYL